MAGRKEFELLFKLQASLGSNFNSSMNGAMNATKQLNGELSKINSLSRKIDGFKKQSAALQANKEKLEKLAEEHDRLQREMSNTEQPSESLRKKMESNARQIEQTTARIREQETRLGTLGDELRDAGVDTNRLSEENERLADSYQEVKKHQEKLASIAQAQQKNAEAISKTKTQLAGTIGVIGAVSAALYAGPVKSSIAFNNEMAGVATLLDGDIQPRVQALSKDVIKLSNATGIGTGDLTDGLYQVVSAFGDSADSVKQLEIAAKSAKAGNATTTDSINLLSAVTKGYGDTSAEAQQKAADLAFMTAKLGQTTYPELAASMGKVVPLASTLTVKQEELFGAMATLTGVTGNTAEVTTQLRGTLQGFLQPTSQMSKAMSKLGYANGKAMLESLGLQGSLDALKKSVNNDEIAFSGLFGSIEAKNAVLALTGEQAENLTAKTLQMYDAAGAAEAAFDIMNNTPEAKIERTKKVIANLGVVFGNIFVPSVTNASVKLTELVTKFADWAQENPDTLKTILKVVGGLAALRVAGLTTKLAYHKVSDTFFNTRTALEHFRMGMKGIPLEAGKTKTAFLGMGKAMRSLKGNTAVMGVFSKIGGVAGKMLPIVGVAALVGGAIYMIATHLEEVRGFIQKVFGDGALAMFDNFVNTIKNIGSAIKELFSGNVGNARKIIEETFGEAGVSAFDAIAKAIESVKAVLPVIMEQFSEMGAAIMPTLAELFSTVVAVLAEAAKSILPILAQLLQAIFPIIGQIASTILPALASIFGALIPIVAEIVTTILPIFVDLLNMILPIITQIVNTVLPMLTQLLQFLIPIIQVVAEVFGSVLGSALQSISTIIGGVMTVFQGLIDFITGVFTGNWSQAWEGVKSIFKGIFDSLSGLVKAPINGVISIINGAISGINKVGFDVPDWVPVIGGKAFKINVPKIPMLAKGSNNTPDTFIAGEAGAELITNARGRKVFTAAQTGRILDNINAAKSATDGATMVTLLPLLQAALSMARVSSNGGVTAPTLSAGAERATSVVIHSQPVFHVGSDADASDIEEVLKRRDEELLNEVDERLRQKEDDERRRKYD